MKCVFYHIWTGQSQAQIMFEKFCPKVEIAKHPSGRSYRIQGWQKVRKAASSIAIDLIDSKEPKHTLFCRKTAFVAIYVLFQG